MNRHWLLTWTCYGTWLPGARQGFVSHVRDDHGELVIHNIPGTPYDADMPKLEAYARSIMTGPPVKLDTPAAEAMIAQYQETCGVRRWELEAASVMYNHTHLVVGVAGDPEPASIRETFKSWATRALKKFRPLPSNGTFWTEKGSIRKLSDERAVRAGEVQSGRLRGSAHLDQPHLASRPAVANWPFTPYPDISAFHVGEPSLHRSLGMKSTLANQPLAELLDQHTRLGAAELWRSEGDRIRCLACGHRCLIGHDQRGICKVRFNDAGKLRVPFGYVAGLQSDPVEKKPFFHVYPGSDALTFGMMGCDLHCSYCQNWLTSQALRDVNSVAPIRTLSAAELVDVAKRERSRLVVSSYNEPLITAEWAVAVFKEAHAAGLACAFVSNGNATPEVLDFLRPWIVAYKVDLKCFNDRNYRKLGGMLENITDTIRMIHERGIWLEIVTLVVPGFNDSAAEMREIARFLVSVSPDIPWHITAFHKDYRMTDPDPTSAEALAQAAQIGVEEGLHFVYAGNMPSRVGQWENTRCPSCQTTLIERTGFLIRSYRINAEGCCPQCKSKVPGVWPRSSGEVKTGNDQKAYLSRLPRGVDGGQWTVDSASRNSAAAASAHVHDRRQGLPIVKEPQLMGEMPQMAVPTSPQRPPAPVRQSPESTRPSLAAQQQERLLTTVARILRNLVTGGPTTFPPDMADVADLQVWGAFVSLKRGKHLRSCSGTLGHLMPLHQAVSHAAERTVWEDERFPPVSPSELGHLDVEVWLLHNPQPVQARGQERAKAITLGKHGIQVIRGQFSGLFLPSVAPDNGWDVQTFLDRVCMKAGMPASAWKEDDCALFIFEGDVLHRKMEEFKGEPLHSPPAPCSATDLPTLANLCRANLTDLLIGAAPRYFSGAPDGMLSGVVFSVDLGTSEEAPTFTRFSMRPGLPLQTTLFSLVQTAAQHLISRGIRAESLQTLNVGLTLLHDPVLHGTVADPHLEGFDPKQRAFLVLERNKAGLVFDAQKTADEVLHDAAERARVSHPATAAVFSLAAVTNAPRFGVSTAPGPVRGPAVRQPAMAGKFYDADPAKLSRTVDGLLTDDLSMEPAAQAKAEHWPAAMVPHAGLQYSGRIAADVLKRIKIPQTVIVIGPNHTGQGMEWAVAPQQTWAMPGFTVASDFILARKLCQAIPGLEMDAVAHQNEHGIEVELPLLARLAPEVKVLGITIGHGDLESCQRFAQGLAEVIRGRPEPPLLLISSDMNHFATDAENRRLDALALAALERGDAKELLDTVNRHNISMCGVLPAVIVLETLKLLGGFKKAVKVGYATTADVTGDKSRVVGYAGMLLA